MRIISIQGLCGIPDSVQHRVRVRLAEATARGERTVLRDYDGFWVEAHCHRGEWTVRLA